MTRSELLRLHTATAAKALPQLVSAIRRSKNVGKLTLQVLPAVLFIVTGWSMVTGGVLSFHVRRDRV